jgi:hypothetical protein
MIGLFENRPDSDDLSPLRKYLPTIKRFLTHGTIAGVGCMILGFVLLNVLHARLEVLTTSQSYFSLTHLTVRRFGGRPFSLGLH